MVRSKGGPLRIRARSQSACPSIRLVTSDGMNGGALPCAGNRVRACAPGANFPASPGQKIKEALDAAGASAVACLRVDSVFVYVSEQGYTLATKHDPWHEVSFESVSDMLGEKIKLESNEFVLVETMEKVNMPKDLMAIIEKLNKCSDKHETKLLIQELKEARAELAQAKKLS